MTELGAQLALADEPQSKDVAPALLGFEAGNQLWLVDLADAGEVLPVPELCDVPLTRSWFRGIANVRGTLYSVTDLAAFHGGELTFIRAQTRLVLTGAKLRADLGGNMALLMAGTQGLKPQATLEALGHDDSGSDQTKGPTMQPWCGTRYRDKDGRIWTHLLLPVLMSATEFLNVAA